MIWLLKTQEQFVFNHPFRCLVTGPSTCGKSDLIQNIIINKDKLINKKLDRIVLCYKVCQEKYNIYKYLDIPVEFNEGIRLFKK